MSPKQSHPLRKVTILFIFLFSNPRMETRSAPVLRCVLDMLARDPVRFGFIWKRSGKICVEPIFSNQAGLNCYPGGYSEEKNTRRRKTNLSSLDVLFTDFFFVGLFALLLFLFDIWPVTHFASAKKEICIYSFLF